MLRTSILVSRFAFGNSSSSSAAVNSKPHVVSRQLPHAHINTQLIYRSSLVIVRLTPRMQRWTCFNFLSFLALTDRAPAVPVSLQAIRLWRWHELPMNASCKWVELLQISSVHVQWINIGIVFFQILYFSLLHKILYNLILFRSDVLCKCPSSLTNLTWFFKTKKWKKRLAISLVREKISLGMTWNKCMILKRHRRSPEMVHFDKEMFSKLIHRLPRK